MTRKELDHAIQASFDGTLTEAECLELRAVLKSNPAARALYYEYADLHQSLIFRISRFTSIDSARSLADIRRHLQSRRTAQLTILAAAAALVILGVVLKLSFVSQSPALATYRGAVGSLFAIEHRSTKQDRSAGELGESTVNLTQGTFEFTFRNGTRGVVLAPAKFEIRSETEILLSLGTAWFEVSEEGKGFRVSTPELVVTDLGTAFGVRSDPESGDEVHVFSGSVEARTSKGAANADVETLVAGQARRCGPLATLEVIPAKPGDFLTELPEPEASNLLANGGFEAGTRPEDADFGHRASAVLLPGWQFGRDVSVAYRSSSGRPGFGRGDRTVISSTSDVQVGFRNSLPDHEVERLDGSIWQTFATTPGQRYEVRFEMGGYFAQAGDLAVTATVREGTSTGGSILGLISATRSGEGPQNSGYEAPRTLTFTAKSGLTTLLLTETSPNSDHSAPVIDNVVVRELPGEHR